MFWGSSTLLSNGSERLGGQPVQRRQPVHGDLLVNLSNQDDLSVVSFFSRSMVAILVDNY
jgi:hypothetical protein